MDNNLKIEYVPIMEIKKYKNNAKIHTEKQIDQIVESIKSFGFNDPIGIWKDEIVEGHGRYEAAKILKLDKVPIIRLDHLTDKERKVYILAHNKLTMNTGFEVENLVLELEELQGFGIDLNLTGFDAAEVDDLFSQVHSKDIKEDDFDEPLPEVPITRQGDIWLLGRHRLICGDSTKPETYKVLMDGKKANLVVTDPPYNINIQGGTKDKLKIKNDSMPDKDFYEFLLKFYKCTYDVMADGAAIYVFHSDTEGINFRTALRDAGFHLSSVCIWVKNSLVLSRSDFHFRHEPVLYAWKPTGKHKWYGDRKQDTIWEFDRPKRSESHPTMKPVPLVAYPITNSSLTNCIVLDPFGGSGTTLIACEQTDRICYTIEVDEKYADVIAKRYYQYLSEHKNSDKATTDKDVFLIRDGEKIKYSDVIKEQ